MSKYEVGSVVKGKVTAIKPFGAFVALDDETQGLVHISQITHSFVKDINEHLSVGDEVDVKILSIDEEANRISLSIKETLPKPKENKKSSKRKPKQNKKANKENKNVTDGFNTMQVELKKWLNKSE